MIFFETRVLWLKNLKAQGLQNKFDSDCTILSLMPSCHYISPCASAWNALSFLLQLTNYSESPGHFPNLQTVRMLPPQKVRPSDPAAVILFLSSGWPLSPPLHWASKKVAQACLRSELLSLAQGLVRSTGASASAWTSARQAQSGCSEELAEFRSLEYKPGSTRRIHECEMETIGCINHWFGKALKYFHNIVCFFSKTDVPSFHEKVIKCVWLKHS